MFSKNHAIVISVPSNDNVAPLTFLMRIEEIRKHPQLTVPGYRF